MNIVHEHGKTWLIREDGWRYPLAGICGMEWRSDWTFSDYGEMRLIVTVSRVTDALLDSLRVLRDELPEHIELFIESNY